MDSITEMIAELAAMEAMAFETAPDTVRSPNTLPQFFCKPISIKVIEIGSLEDFLNSI